MHWKKGLAMLLLATVNIVAEEFKFESLGGRFGFSANNRTKDLRQADIIAAWTLPWGWQPGTHWRLQTHLEFTAGGIFGQGPDAFISSLGPTLSLGRVQFPISLEIGVSPTILSRKEIGNTDFGGAFQFSSHAGLNWDFGSHFRVGYRFHHMSDAGITEHNPGLNLHLFLASYRF